MQNLPRGGAGGFSFSYVLSWRRPLRMEEKLVAAATAHARCAAICLELNSGTRLKHAPPALGTGAGTSRTRFEKSVPAPRCDVVRSTTNCAHSECCAARTRPARSALPLRTSRHPFACFTPSLSVSFCSQSLRVPGSWRHTPSKNIGTVRRAPPACSTALPAALACSPPAPVFDCLPSLDICGTRSGMRGLA